MRNLTISLLSLTLDVVRRQYVIPLVLRNVLSHDFHALHAIPSDDALLHSAAQHQVALPLEDLDHEEFKV